MDAADADRLVAEALWEKREPYLVNLVEEGRDEGMAEGEATGLAQAVLRNFDHHGIKFRNPNGVV